MRPESAFESSSKESPKGSPKAYTIRELMVCAAAREIRDGEVVFVGMRLPLIAFAVAKRTHAPRAIGLFENGVIRFKPAPEIIYTMADPPNLLGATQCLDMMSVMSLLQAGRVDVGFLGAAEVDRFGNLNSTRVFLPDAGTRPASGTGIEPGSFIRLPGSGGACDIASLAQRFVVLLEHHAKRLPERVSYVTSPGNGDGPGWRRRAGLPRGGPAAIITTMAVFRFDDEGQAYLSSVHPGFSAEEVSANTGWKLRVAENVETTPEPSPEELAAVREYDPQGFWTS